jgi:phosphatidylinositol alpha-mannosyltransferase
MPLLKPRGRSGLHLELPAPSLPMARVQHARPLRIALVTEYYYPHLGGICEHVHFFAREARRHGHRVDIITSRLAGAGDEPHVFRIGRSQPVYVNGSLARVTVGWGVRRELRRVLRRGRYDIVHVHSPLSPVLPVLAIEEADCPVVGTFHTYFERRYFQSRLDRLRAAIAVSHSTTVALNRYFEANWTIVPNGIDVDVFHPRAPRPAAFRADVPVILFLGRFDPRNGLTTLIEAFRKVRSRRREAQLVVAGDGPLRSHYHRVGGGDPDITFVGPILRERPGYYAHSAIYACPSTRASFGITLLESMACETPVVCSDIHGFRDVVKHEREALMVPSGDRTALADALVRLLDDETLRKRLGKRGRQEAQQYSWTGVTSAVLDIYTAVLAGQASR